MLAECKKVRFPVENRRRILQQASQGDFSGLDEFSRPKGIEANCVFARQGIE